MPKEWRLNMTKNSEALILNKHSLNKSAILAKDEKLLSAILRRCRFFIFIRKIDKISPNAGIQFKK